MKTLQLNVLEVIKSKYWCCQCFSVWCCFIHFPAADVEGRCDVTEPQFRPGKLLKYCKNGYSGVITDHEPCSLNDHLMFDWFQFIKIHMLTWFRCDGVMFVLCSSFNVPHQPGWRLHTYIISASLRGGQLMYLTTVLRYLNFTWVLQFNGILYFFFHVPLQYFLLHWIYLAE